MNHSIDFKCIWIPFLISLCAGSSAKGQEKGVYGSWDLFMNFGLAALDAPSGEKVDNVLRWAPVLNVAGMSNLDLSKGFGVYAGIGMENVGFITALPDTTDQFKVKYRTYNLHLPIGIKLGRLSQERPLFLFGGYSMEVPVSYKEKQFAEGERERRTVAWFTDRTPLLMHAVHGGIQLPNGLALKAKYYLTSFFNPDYTEFTDGPNPGERTEVKKYAEFNANVVTISVSYYPFQNTNYWQNKATQGEKEYRMVRQKYPPYHAKHKSIFRRIARRPPGAHHW